MYIQVNIGRNFEHSTLGTVPMVSDKWREFQEQVVYILLQLREHTDMGEPSVEIHLGVGEWDGVPEESAKISVYNEGGFDLVQVKNELRDLAKQFGQNTIALIVGSELIEADTEHTCACGRYYASGIPKSHRDHCNR